MSRLYDALQNARSKSPVEALPRSMALPDHAVPVTVGADMEILRLYQAIENRLAAQPNKVVQVIACGEGEGATTVAGRLARFAALRMGRTVVLLTASAQPAMQNQVRLPRPVLPELPAQPPMTADAMPEIRQEEDSRLFIGHLPNQGGPADIHALNPLALRDYWNCLRERVDLVVIDAPPALNSPLGLAIAPTVDGVVLVIEAERTRRAVAEAARDALMTAGATILGTVLNKRRFYVPQFLYDRL